jgi:hypothetical protein
MDNFSLKPEPKVKRKPAIWNILTVLVLVGTCGLAYYFLTIFANPTSAYNPFPPVALPTLYQTATFTPTIILKPATWTPSPTTSPLPTRTKAPTWTSVPLVVTPSVTMTPTETPITGTEGISSTAMPASAEITYVASTTMHPDLGCKWMGVGGKVFDANNKPLPLLTAQLGGTFNGKVINFLSISGSNPAYGTSGFEFEKLGDLPSASTHSLWTQLFDNNGRPLTEKIYFDTFDDCDKNLVMIIFTRTR